MYDETREQENEINLDDGQPSRRTIKITDVS